MTDGSPILRLHLLVLCFVCERSGDERQVLVVLLPSGRYILMVSYANIHFQKSVKEEHLPGWLKHAVCYSFLFSAVTPAPEMYTSYSVYRTQEDTIFDIGCHFTTFETQLVHTKLYVLYIVDT